MVSDQSKSSYLKKSLRTSFLRDSKLLFVKYVTLNLFVNKNTFLVDVTIRVYQTPTNEKIVPTKKLAAKFFANRSSPTIIFQQ